MNHLEKVFRLVGFFLSSALIPGLTRLNHSVTIEEVSKITEPFGIRHSKTLDEPKGIEGFLMAAKVAPTGPGTDGSLFHSGGRSFFFWLIERLTFVGIPQVY